jgi:hypothetical protein
VISRKIRFRIADVLAEIRTEYLSGHKSGALPLHQPTRWVSDIVHSDDTEQVGSSGNISES